MLCFHVKKKNNSSDFSQITVYKPPNSTTGKNSSYTRNGISMTFTECIYDPQRMNAVNSEHL